MSRSVAEINSEIAEIKSEIAGIKKSHPDFLEHAAILEYVTSLTKQVTALSLSGINTPPFSLFSFGIFNGAIFFFSSFTFYCCFWPGRDYN